MHPESTSGHARHGAVGARRRDHSLTVYGDQSRSLLAQELASAFLRSAWTQEALAEAGSGCLDRWPRWMVPLTFAMVAAFREPPTDRRGVLIEYIQAFLASRPAPPGDPEPPQILRLLSPTGRSQPQRQTQIQHDWPIAEIASVASLAETLELSIGHLEWLADVKGLERTATEEKLRNYRYATVRRRNGRSRVIEAPKARLKEVQRWILREILDQVPVHAAAHGFARGRSVRTNAEPHIDQRVVLGLDLKDYFVSVAARRIFGIFSALDYEPSVAHVLTGICTNVVPRAIWAEILAASDPRLIQGRFWLGRQLATPHLPQGAPTSPALANLASFRFDRRLTGLAVSLDCRYSRYADDLTFSGPDSLRRRRRQLEALVAEIASDEGFMLNSDKSRLHTAGARQSVCGVVVNVRPNVVRREYEQLKAILHNAARHGPQSQNHSGINDFAAHLSGRIAWISSLNPDKGTRLRHQFAQIQWDRPPPT